jgi:tetratricopeptide (TPR) repeat protein
MEPIRLVISFILLYLVVNTISTFANGESFTISIASPNDFSGKDPDKTEPIFKYFQIFEIILFDIEHDQEDMIELLRQYYSNNQTILKIVNKFEQDYNEHTPIWWYTREGFLSSLINQALQTMDMKILIKMGLFLRDLCKQIENSYAQKSNSSYSLTVYRCLRLPISNFEKLQQNNNFYASFNSFLLTNFDQELATEICSTSEQNIEILPVLFEIKIEGTTSEFTPFVSLDHLSYNFNSKKEILFSMNSVFRIVSVRKNQRNIWQIQMVAINDNDFSLRFSIALMHIKTSQKKGWDKLGHIMILMRQLKHAEELYKILLGLIDVDDNKEMIHLYDNLATIKLDNGSYEEAYFFVEKKLQIQQNILAPNHLALASTYATIAILNSKMRKLEDALSFHKKALEIQKRILPSNHRDLAITYDNIGVVHSKMGNHIIALLFHQKALQINEEVLPPNDLDLAINYNNIAGEYKFMGDYEKALRFFQKAIQIKEIILSADDPELAFTYDNIGGVYQDMEQYDNALFFYEKALKINEKVLHSNHPELSITYNNIANLNSHMGNYLNAFSFYQKALEIAQTSLPANHPTIADFCNNIGDVYFKMRKFENALLFYEKALEIQKISLSHHHSDFVLTYMNLGNLYYTTGKYSTALSYFELGLEIGEVSLTENHRWLKTLRQNIALLEKEL